MIKWFHDEPYCVQIFFLGFIISSIVIFDLEDPPPQTVQDHYSKPHSSRDTSISDFSNNQLRTQVPRRVSIAWGPEN